MTACFEIRQTTIMQTLILKHNFLSYPSALFNLKSAILHPILFTLKIAHSYPTNKSHITFWFKNGFVIWNNDDIFIAISFCIHNFECQKSENITWRRKTILFLISLLSVLCPCLLAALIHTMVNGAQLPASSFREIGAWYYVGFPFSNCNFTKLDCIFLNLE